MRVRAFLNRARPIGIGCGCHPGVRSAELAGLVCSGIRGGVVMTSYQLPRAFFAPCANRQLPLVVPNIVGAPSVNSNRLARPRAPSVLGAAAPPAACRPPARCRGPVSCNDNGVAWRVGVVQVTTSITCVRRRLLRDRNESRPLPEAAH